MTVNFCDTCCHQYSDICGTCESLEGVPIGYSPKSENVRPITQEFEIVHGVVDAEKGVLILNPNPVDFVDRKKTHLEELRAMNAEELAKTISGEEIYPWCAEACKYDSCYDCVLAWLKQEVSDDS